MSSNALDAYRYSLMGAQQQSLSMGVFGQSPFGGLLEVGVGGSAPTPMPTEPLSNKLLLLTEEEEMP